MLTTNAAGLLRTIITDPSDVFARLVYADWLEERGDPRGEFIRIQCELFQRFWDHKWQRWPELYSPEDLPIVNDLHDRQKRLLEQYALEWCRGLGFGFVLACTGGYQIGCCYGGTGEAKVEVEFQRGFIVNIECTVSAWLGGRCLCCEGTGGGWDQTWLGRGYEDCTTCRGTGRENAYGPAIVSDTPLEMVWFSDVSPETIDREPGFKDYWCWPARQNHPLWPLMKSKFLLRGHDSWRDTEEECMMDASKAAILWARSKAGMPKGSHKGKTDDRK